MESNDTFQVRAFCIQFPAVTIAVQIVTGLQLLLLMFVMRFVLYCSYKPAACSWQCMDALLYCPA